MTAERHIVIVDDSLTVVKSLAKILQGFGLRTTEVTDGGKAVETVLGALPDLLILDLVMPAVNGLDLLRTLRGYPQLRTMPIVVLTASKEEESLVPALENGADDYITKPFNPPILLARLQTQLRSRQLLNQLQAANQQLEQAQVAAVEKEKLKTAIELAGATAHKLNQPLTSIVCYADLLLKKTAGGSEDYRAIKSICDESNRMAEILRKMSELTEIRTSEYVGTTTIIDLDERRD